jgi:hypothetical protein
MINLGDRVELKKNHACGKKSNIFIVMRVGADIKIKCEVCGRELMLARAKADKMIKKILRNNIT